MLAPESFDARLKEANLASKNDIIDFVKKADFDNKLKIINKEFTSNEARHIEVNKKLDYITKEVKSISTRD